METFIVRVWVPAVGPDHADTIGLHGSVEHAGSRRLAHFRTPEELLAILDDAVERSREGAPLPLKET